MKKHIPNVLLVEGSNDKTFFENLCKAYNLHVYVKVSNPLDFSINGAFNSKRGVIDSLDHLLPFWRMRTLLFKNSYYFRC